VLSVSGPGCAHLCVQVPPVPLQKILDAAPDRLQRSSGEAVGCTDVFTSSGKQEVFPNAAGLCAKLGS